MPYLALAACKNCEKIHGPEATQLRVFGHSSPNKGRKWTQTRVCFYNQHSIVFDIIKDGNLCYSMLLTITAQGLYKTLKVKWICGASQKSTEEPDQGHRGHTRRWELQEKLGWSEKSSCMLSMMPLRREEEVEHRGWWGNAAVANDTVYQATGCRMPGVDSNVDCDSVDHEVSV